MSGREGALITAIEREGAAARAGVRPGERLKAIDGRPVRDLIDYLILSAGADPRLTLCGPAGERTLKVAKDEDESLGLSFDAAVFDGIRRCGNRCVFCFVDQLPTGLRPSLYVKDEDYRLSFLQGNYVTLTGLSRADRDRIVRRRLSPLYVSVHATDPEIRGHLLGRRRPAPILPLLADLAAHGIRLQTQAVICPGWNDGDVLQRTIDDLASLWPGVHSLAVVPVGLTAHRAGLTPLRPFARRGARELLALVENRQEKYAGTIGTRFVFAADEFYLLAGRRLPPADRYEDYPQLENGVGLIRAFEDGFRASWRRWRRACPPGTVRVVTGAAAAGMWGRLARLVGRAGLRLEILPVINGLFGGSVTVAGLLAGADIIRALRDRASMPTFVPRIALRRGEDVFLDGVTAAELTAITGAEVIDTDPEAFLERAVRVLDHA